ncbi:MBL fold metallo-hydrolase [Paenibacillus sp. PL2-23]|uniref:MBL fold metallo-hydrolase n=1 Tax=Paenibacillus sp. PL2-23 TaxID=2100729 RepID=UPI0030F5D41F
MSTIAGGIKPSELARFVLDRRELVILDVRNEPDYNAWRIEGASIQSVNIPYFELLDGVEEAVKQLPVDREVVVVCAKEGSSVFVAEQLVEEGLSAVRYLEGGMRAWSEHLEPVSIGGLSGGGELYQFNRLGKGCLSYMAIAGGEALVVDAQRLTDVYERIAAERGAAIRYVLDTHLHADHISGGRSLAERTGARYYLPPRDAEEAEFSYESLTDASVLRLGSDGVPVAAFYSPGHTIGSTSLIVDDHYLLSGDILFVSSIGRPDLAGHAEQWAEELRRTLYGSYSELPKELLVLPAHFGHPGELDEHGRVAASLGDLFQGNPGLDLPESQFCRIVTTNLPEQPNAFQQIRLTNLGKLNPSEEERSDMEIGPNRCAVHDH